MTAIVPLLNRAQDLIESARHVDFLGPLALRLYLAPIFIAAGMVKLSSFPDTVAWFGNPDWGLGLPFPYLMAMLATWTEILGGLALLAGVAVRWVSIPLLFTMLVAATTAHWENGWFAIAPSDPDTSMAKVLAVVGFPGAQESLENSEEVSKRLSAARNLLQRHGHYDWLTGKGGFVILNDGIEFSVTYLIMCLVLLFTGAGRYVSVDYWLARRFRPGAVNC